MRNRIGSILIVTSLLLLSYIYYPFLSAFFIPLNTSILSDSSFYISIPKIKALAPIIENVDPWNKSDYERKLKKGIASAKGFALPGQKGNIYLFAHSSLDPWEMTRVNTAFLRLGELRSGDKIMIHKDGKDYSYQVVDKKVVWPSELDQIKIAGDNLILQTCTPIGTDFKRLLVFAKKV